MEITIDYETYLFKPGHMAPKTVCLSYADEEDSGLLVGDDIPEFLEQLLDNEDLIIIGHNMSYDMMCSIQNYHHLIPKIWKAYDDYRIQCTYVREKLIDIAAGQKGPRPLYSLAKLVKKHFDIELDKTTWRLGYDKLDGVPLEEWPEGAKEYAMDDSIVTHQLYLNQAKRARRLEYEHFFNEAARQACYAIALNLTSARGLMIDQEQVAKLKAELEPAIAEAIDRAKEYDLFHPQNKKDIKEGKHRKNLKNIRQLVKETYPDKDNIPLTDGGKSGRKQVKTDAETIEKCDHPGLNAISDLNSLTKTDSTYVEVYRKAGNLPLHCSYDVLGATSGRTSSWNTNIQNQPRMPGIRECIRARAGWVLVCCDYDSQEIRTLGQSCQLLLGESAIAQKYKQDPDFDPHTHFAAQLLGYSYEEALKKKAEEDEELLEFRQRSKCANFGFPGGLGVDTFREYARKNYGVELDEEEAKKLRDQWFDQWPEMKRYFNYISNLVRTDGTVIQLQSGRVRGDCGYCDAANTYFQGLAADASKSALYEVTKECFSEPGSSPLSGCRPVLFIHDEIGIEAPEEYAHEAAIRLEEVMVKAMEEVCPDVPARASAALMRWWSKKAKRVTNEEGRLIPWEDKEEN